MKRLLTVIGIIAILSIIWSFFMKGNAEVNSAPVATEVAKVEAVQKADAVTEKKSGVVSGIETFSRVHRFYKCDDGTCCYDCSRPYIYFSGY